METQEKTKLVVGNLPTWLMLDFFQRAVDMAEIFFPEPPPKVEVTETAIAAWPAMPRVRLIPGVDHIRLSVDGDTVASAQLSPTGKWTLQVRHDLFGGEAVKMIPSEERQLLLIAERSTRLGHPQ